MNLYVGTSGYSYKEWKGSFYPAALPERQMLRYYGERFRTVEINNTFYRLPGASVLQAWAGQVLADFLFVLKASQRITHRKRLKDAGDALSSLLEVAGVLKERLGPLLFQLPPNMQKDVERLKTFLGFLPHGRRFTFEFRHSSWFDEDVVAALNENDVAMTIIDQDDFATPPIATASWGYVRLHRLDYDDTTLKQWAERVKEHGWSDVYVYFKHDEGVGSGPPAVDSFVKLLKN